MNYKISTTIAFLLVLSLCFVFAAGDNASAIGVGEQVQEKVQVQEGTHVGENGQMFKIQAQANNRYKLECGNVSAECECEMTQATVQEKTQLFVGMSNGNQAEIKVMPDTASEKALERLRLKVCSEENNCTIELKEVGKREKVQLAYELQTKRQAKVFGLFKAQMKVSSQVSAENGEIIRVNKPWWAFLASEPAEE